MKKEDLEKQIELLEEEIMRLRAENEQLKRALYGERSNIYVVKEENTLRQLTWESIRLLIGREKVRFLHGVLQVGSTPTRQPRRGAQEAGSNPGRDSWAQKQATNAGKVLQVARLLAKQ